MSRKKPPLPPVVFPDVADARLALLEAVRAGRSVDCPCCDRLARIYKRSFYAVMGKFLCDLARLTFEKESEWIHVDSLNPKNGNYAFLVHWGFAEPRDKRNEVANALGYWRITPSGLAFAKGSTRAPAAVELFQNTPIGWDKKTVSIEEALKKQFDYFELMKGVPR